MRISEMHITPIAISDPPLLNAAGLHAPYALRTIVELVSDDHISGLGEMPGGAEMVAALESIRELVLGRDPFQLNALSLAIAEHLANASALATPSWLARNAPRAPSARSKWPAWT